MRIVFGLTLLLVICAHTIMAQMTNAVYVVSSDSPVSNSNPQITSQDGKPFVIKAKALLHIRKGVIYSQNNENTSFYLNLTLPYDEGFTSADLLLVVDETAYRPNGSGSTKDVESTLGFVIEGLENAKQVARHFGLTPVYRQHPNYNFLVSFTPSKKMFQVGEEVFVTLKVQNIGMETVAFMKGGMNRGARDNQYGFSGF